MEPLFFSICVQILEEKREDTENEKLETQNMTHYQNTSLNCPFDYESDRETILYILGSFLETCVDIRIYSVKLQLITNKLLCQGMSYIFGHLCLYAIAIDLKRAPKIDRNVFRLIMAEEINI